MVVKVARENMFIQEQSAGSRRKLFELLKNSLMVLSVSDPRKKGKYVASHTSENSSFSAGTITK